MSTIERSVEVEVPVQTAYNQWTQFQEFPKFMEGVEEVQQLDDVHVRWVAEIAGKRREWTAEITEQHPDHRIAWRASEGDGTSGVVTFHRLADDRTQIMLQLDWSPEGPAEKLGDWLGVAERRVSGDLARFKELIEARGDETGAWRGEIEEPATQRGQPG